MSIYEIRKSLTFSVSSDTTAVMELSLWPQSRWERIGEEKKARAQAKPNQAVLPECISDHEKHMKDVGVLDQTVVTWLVPASLAEKLEEALLLLLLLLGCQIQQCLCCRKVFWRKNTYSQVQVWLRRVTRGPGVGTCCPSDSTEFLRGQYWSMTVRKVSPKQRACRECVCCQLAVLANRASVSVCGCRQC